LKALKTKPTNSIKIMPHQRLSNNIFWDKKLEKILIIIKKLQFIWTYENMVKF